MIDVQAREISEKDLEAGLRFAHPEVSHQMFDRHSQPLYLQNSSKMPESDCTGS